MIVPSLLVIGMGVGWLFLGLSYLCVSYLQKKAVDKHLSKITQEGLALWTSQEGEEEYWQAYCSLHFWGLIVNDMPVDEPNSVIGRSRKRGIIFCLVGIAFLTAGLLIRL